MIRRIVVTGSSGKAGRAVVHEMAPDDYQRFPTFWRDPQLRKWNLWSYVDARDVVQSCRLGLEAPIPGAEVFIIAAADTVMPQPNRDLLATVFPTVPLREGTGDHETLLSIDKAHHLLGYSPHYSWRDHIDPTRSEEWTRQPSP